MYKFLCGHQFPFLLEKQLGVELLGYMVILCLTFELFSTAATQFYYFTSFILFYVHLQSAGAYSLGEFTTEHR